ncbi:MAG: PIN domain-containing protein [Actinobacteria bacterium]|nr:PIN domain-containing protein [Actinomycetota bacterium]
MRTLNDCLIAAVAIRSGATVLHSDRDFDAIARHTELRIELVPSPGH